MKKKNKKNQKDLSVVNKLNEKVDRQYTVEELLELGSKKNKIEIAPDMLKKD